MTATVRLGTRADETQLMDLCRALHADNGLFSMNEDMVKAVLHHAFDRKGGIIGVIDGDGVIAAAIYVLLSKFWYSDDDHLEELFSFVRPQYRKSTHATTLIAFAKKCSDQIGLPLVIGVITNKQMEAKVRLYRKSLGMPAGAFFVYGSQWQSDSTDLETWKSIADGMRARKITKGARVIPEETLRQIGAGEVERGRARLDKFIEREIRLNGPLPAAVMTTLPLLPMNGA